ncbi:MAG: thrombospondin type 3 repeat-containing protein [bacterium]|nr:thrombospondin type 3 repeat-containing protein [bacterium]
MRIASVRNVAFLILILFSVVGGIAAQADSDSDGIADIRDNCPFVPGPFSNRGCPLETPVPSAASAPSVADRDSDGVPDFVDNCPDQVGTGFTGGCPSGDGSAPPASAPAQTAVPSVPTRVLFPAVDLCLIGSNSTVNVRTQPTVASDVVQRIGLEEYLLVAARVTNPLGETWWYAPGAGDGIGGFVRADVVQASSFCSDADLPAPFAAAPRDPVQTGDSALIDWEDLYDGGLVVINTRSNAVTPVIPIEVLADVPFVSVVIDGVEVVNDPLNPRGVVVLTGLPTSSNARTGGCPPFELALDDSLSPEGAQALASVVAVGSTGGNSPFQDEDQETEAGGQSQGGETTGQSGGASDSFGGVASGDGESACPEGGDDTSNVSILVTLPPDDQPVDCPPFALALDDSLSPEGTQALASVVAVGGTVGNSPLQDENQETADNEPEGANAPEGASQNPGVSDGFGGAASDEAADCGESTEGVAVLVFPLIGDQPGECPEYEFNGRFTPARGTQALESLLPGVQPSAQNRASEPSNADCTILLFYPIGSSENAGRGYRLEVPLQGRID